VPALAKALVAAGLLVPAGVLVRALHLTRAAADGRAAAEDAYARERGFTLIRDDAGGYVAHRTEGGLASRIEVRGDGRSAFTVVAVAVPRAGRRFFLQQQMVVHDQAKIEGLTEAPTGHAAFDEALVVYAEGRMPRALTSAPIRAALLGIQALDLGLHGVERRAEEVVIELDDRVSDPAVLDRLLDVARLLAEADEMPPDVLERVDRPLVRTPTIETRARTWRTVSRVALVVAAVAALPGAAIPPGRRGFVRSIGNDRVPFSGRVGQPQPEREQSRHRRARLHDAGSAGHRSGGLVALRRELRDVVRGRCRRRRAGAPASQSRRQLSAGRRSSESDTTRSIDRSGREC
jgi:hypothetical protein